MPRQGSPPSSLRVPLSSAAQTGLRFSVASEALTEDQRRASERGVKEFALQADGETPWEVESDHRQTEVLMRSVRGGITPRQQPDQPMTTASRPQGQPLDDWALQAAEDAGNDENPFVQTGANVALRQCCCTSLVATARSFSQLDWFPKCTSGEGLAPEHHGDALARTESISERSRCNIKREQLYTICSGRWSRASDRSRLGWIVWWLNVMAVTGVALIVGEAVDFLYRDVRGLYRQAVLTDVAWCCSCGHDAMRRYTRLGKDNRRQRANAGANSKRIHACAR